jgi:Skp family chaperone for outer membrane proteins
MGTGPRRRKRRIPIPPKFPIPALTPAPNPAIPRLPRGRTQKGFLAARTAALPPNAIGGFFVKRTYALLAGVLGFVGAAASVQAQAPAPATPPAAAPARTDRPRIAVFNVAKVMKEFGKWQYWSATMQNKRFDAQMELMKLRAEVMELTKKVETEVQQAKKEELGRLLVVRQREFEDKEGTARKTLDTESAQLLKTMYTEIQTAVKAIVEQNGYDVVFTHIDATTTEEAQSPMLIDMKMRPNGAVPFYVSNSVDISKVLVDTLNANFKAPGPIPQIKQMTAPVAGGPAAGGPITPVSAPAPVPTPGR